MMSEIKGDKMKEKLDKITLEDVTLIFKNFSGREGSYNREGDRSFAVVLDEYIAGELTKDGWNVKEFCQKDRDDGEPCIYHLSVKVNFSGRIKPNVQIIKTSGMLALDENTVGMLDFQSIKSADLVINPYHWEVKGNKGVSAYLHTLYATIEESPLDLKYADLL